MGKLLKAILLLFAFLAVVGILSPPDNGDRGGGRRIETGTVAPRPPDLRKEALQQITIETFSWSKGGFGSVMMLNKLVVKNSSKYPAKDFLIACTLTAPSGTAVDILARRLYETVTAGKQRTFHQLNMGFVHGQAARAACQVTDASIDLSAPTSRPTAARWQTNISGSPKQ